MGKAISTLREKLSLKQPKRVLMLGICGSGKTTILYKLKLGDQAANIPTIGFSVEAIEHRDLNINCFDIGKHINLILRHYPPITDGLIFVFDSADKEGLPKAREELHSLLKNEYLRRVPLLLFANKLDIRELSISEIIKEMEIESIPGTWRIQETCGISGKGLDEGIQWISQEIDKLKTK